MPISSFIGREEEERRLCELIESCRLVTVVGAGGIGKTRLVTEAVATLGARFPGGVRRAELAPITPRPRIEVEVAAELGFASLEALTLGLGEDRTLLVLDNCEHVLIATARLCAELLRRCPTLHLLATSREPLVVDGEHLLSLGPLGLPERTDGRAAARAPAVRLYADRARAAGASPSTGDALEAVAELCRRLDGIPLAIELAAARARALSPAEILAHLDRRFDLLRRTAPVGTARHASLRAAIDTSYQLLEPEEQVFFRRIGVFAGPFDAALAAAVAGEPEAGELHTIDLLSRLVDRSLLVAEPHLARLTRYHLLESLRHYSRAQAAAAGETPELRARFVAAMIVEADRMVRSGLSQWTAAVLATVRMHFPNWTAAIEACLERDETAERAFRLLLPMWGMVHQGRAAEITGLYERIQARWPEGDEPLRAEAAAVAACAYLVAGSPDSAVEMGDETLRRSTATPLARVLARRTLALAARHRGDLAAAASLFRKGRDDAAATGLAPFERELTAFVASVEGLTSDLEAALSTLDAVTARGARDGDSISQVFAWLVRCHLLLHADRVDEARAGLAAAQRIQTSFDYPYGQNFAARLQAILQTLEEGWAETRPLWREVIDRNVATGDLGELAATLRAAATLARRAGDAASAQALSEAVPAGSYLAVLGNALPGRLLAEVPPAEALPAGTVSSMHRVRELLGREAPEAPAEDSVEDPAEDPPTPADETPIAARRGAALGDRPDPEAGRPAVPPLAELRRAGDGWTVRFAGRSVQLRALKGVDDLALLLARPMQDVHCLELMGAGGVVQGGVPGLDERARREYETRVRELQAEIDEARSDNDPLRAERREAELEVLVQQLTAAFGLAGRERPAGASAERARSAVTWRIRTAIKRVQEIHPELGRHLANAIRTGTWCSYRPESEVQWRVESARGGGEGG